MSGGGTLANRKGNGVDQGIGISWLGTSSTQVWWALARLCVLKVTDRGGGGSSTSTLLASRGVDDHRCC